MKDLANEDKENEKDDDEFKDIDIYVINGTYKIIKLKRKILRML